MSDKIKELAEQAGMTDDKFGMFFAKNKHNEDGVDLEKFAELIIRECAELAREWEDDYVVEDTAPHHSDVKIKKYFGVEE